MKQKFTAPPASGLAPDLTPSQEKKLKKALRDADKARLEILQKTRNPVEAFIVWRHIAVEGLPVRKGDKKHAEVRH